MSKIYTKTGDDGTTGLLSSRRVTKDDPRIEAYGTVDELNAALGVVRATGLDDDMDALLARLQMDLFTVGSALADPDPEGPFFDSIGPAHINRLESAIDQTEASLEPLTQFILPGGTTGAAHLHLARTVARRAERQAIALSRQHVGAVAPLLLIYLNRLSDLLFVLARVANHRAGKADVVWTGIA